MNLIFSINLFNCILALILFIVGLVQGSNFTGYFSAFLGWGVACIWTWNNPELTKLKNRSIK